MKNFRQNFFTLEQKMENMTDRYSRINDPKMNQLFNEKVWPIYKKYNRDAEILANVYDLKVVSRTFYYRECERQIERRIQSLVELFQMLSWEDQIKFYLLSSDQEYLYEHLDDCQKSTVGIMS